MRRTLVPRSILGGGALALAGVSLIGAQRPASPAAPAASRPLTHGRQSVRLAAHRVTIKTAASLGPLETVVQTLNNCGPSSVAAVMAYWHVYRSEAQVAAVLRADNSYWGMSPDDLPSYAQSLGLRALVGYGGSERLIRALISNGFPVIASQYVSLADPIRHYRPIEAYNDRTRTFVSADPYLGAGHVISYAEFNSIWPESDRRFQVIYPPAKQTLLNAVLRASGWNRRQTYQGAIAWEERQMRTADFEAAGSWIWSNGRADVAFDQAQLGEFKQATATINSAARQGVSPVLVGWVRHEIWRLQHHR